MDFVKEESETAVMRRFKEPYLVATWFP